MRTVENGSGTVCGCAVGDDGTVDNGSALSCLGQTERFTTVLRESASGRLEGPPTAEDGCDLQLQEPISSRQHVQIKTSTLGTVENRSGGQPNITKRAKSMSQLRSQVMSQVVSQSMSQALSRASGEAHCEKCRRQPASKAAVI